MDKRRARLEVFLANIEKNAERIRNGGDALSLRGKYAGRAAVVVGAGPGLERNCAALAGRGDILVFVCDRARDRLAALGVRPDFVVTADPDAATGSFIRAPGVEGDTLLASTYASPEILSLPWSRVLYYNTTDADVWFNSRSGLLAPGVGFVEGGMIVSIFAYLLAEAMGCSPVAFAGNDLCADSPEPEWADNEDYECVTLSTGATLHTLKSFLLSLDWFDSRLAAHRRAGVLREVYNCTEGGIMTTRNIPAMPLAEFVGRYKRK